MTGDDDRCGLCGGTRDKPECWMGLTPHRCDSSFHDGNKVARAMDEAEAVMTHSGFAVLKAHIEGLAQRAEDAQR